MLRLLDGANDALPKPFRGPLNFGLLPSGGFSPASLFAAGEQGVWYDPSDLGTLFQDHLGTIPAAYGSPVGLMLDKSKGLVLGPELVVNGDFSGGAAGWSLGGSSRVESGRAYLDTAVAGEVLTQSAVPIRSGKYYEVRYEVLTTSGQALVPRLSGNSASSGPATTIVGKHRCIILAVSDTSKFAFNVSSSGVSAVVDSISVREIPGNHATQPTVTARPTLMQDAGGRAYLYRDPVDDVLPWTVPAGNYDIFHVPLTGPATILTAQALNGATDTLLTENTRGYLAVNRRLTGAEIAQLQTYSGAAA